MQPPLVSKSEYARLKAVSRQRVGQWISEGKIGSEALVGEGPSARINVAVADKHLNRRIDIGQRFGNGLSTKIRTRPALVVAPAARGASPQVAAVADDPIEEQIKREKLEGLQRENRKRAVEEAALAGYYVRTEVAKASTVKVLARQMTMFEGAVSEMAASAAAKFNNPQRDVLHLMRQDFRAFRVRAAAAMSEEALSLPAFVEEEEIETPPAGEDADQSAADRPASADSLQPAKLN